MKFGVTFVPHTSMLSGKLLLNGKGEVHLTETGLISDGNLAKFNIPFLLSIYQRLLSNWSTLTVPYSRVIRHDYTGYWVNLTILKCLFLLLLVLLAVPATGLLMSTIDPSHPPIGAGVLATIAILCGVVLISGRRRHRVTFRLPTGRKNVMIFTIAGPPSQTRAEFTRILKEYVATAREYKPEASR
jgi:hypothetical protein